MWVLSYPPSRPRDRKLESFLHLGCHVGCGGVASWWFYSWLSCPLTRGGCCHIRSLSPTTSLQSDAKESRSWYAGLCSVLSNTCLTHWGGRGHSITTLIQADWSGGGKYALSGKWKKGSESFKLALQCLLGTGEKGCVNTRRWGLEPLLKLFHIARSCGAGILRYWFYTASLS